MRLIGYIEGVEVTFDFYPPNTFRAVFPRQLDGTYIVELHAIDDAGNETVYTNLFVLIDFQSMIFRVLGTDFGVTNNSDNYLFHVSEPNMEYKQMAQVYRADIVDNYGHRLVIR